MKNIFVSSTFRDMQAERDLVQKEVLPQLRSKARKYGENINMIDLRWGVDTSELESEEGSMKVMSVCLDEVERSRPYMLIFLGERYGSIISPELTEKVIARKNSDFKLDDYAISITAMEVEFGMLSQQFDSLENCVVCMRNFSPALIGDEKDRAVYRAEDEERAKKQQAFKERIMEKVQGRVIEYTCDWDEQKKQLVNFRTMQGETLSDKLVHTYETMFQKEWDAYSELFWTEKEELAVDALVESKLRNFKGREQLVDTYYQKVIEEQGILVLKGEVGSGKTSMMCKLMQRLEQDHKKVFRFVANNSSMSEKAFHLVRQMVYYLENQVGEKHYEITLREERKRNIESSSDAIKEIEDIFERQEKYLGRYTDWLKHLKKLIRKLNSEDTIYMVIDAVDQLQQDEAVRKLDFIFHNANLRYILSANCEYEVPSFMNGCNIVEEKVPALNEQDIQDVMEGLLTASSRNVYKDIRQEISSKKFADNPFYISMLIQRLNMMGFEELHNAWNEQDIIEHSLEVIRKIPDDMEAAAVFLLEEAIERLAADKQSLRDVIHLIGVSRNGLRENDILAISKSIGNTVTQLDISRLIHYLDTFFVTHKDGRIDFTHMVIRRGVRLVADNDRCVKLIAARVKILAEDMNDTFWQSEGMYYARVTADAKAAEAVFRAAELSDVILDAIKAEAIADEGEFYCRCMNQMEEITKFFCLLWCEMWERKKAEQALNEKVYRSFLLWIEKKNREKIHREPYVLTYLAKAYSNMVKILYERGANEEGYIYSKKALDARVRLCEVFENVRVKKELAKEYSKFGIALLKARKMEEAESYLEEAVRLSEEIFQDDIIKDDYSPDAIHFLYICYMNRGHGFFYQEKFEEAISYYQKTIKIMEKVDEKETKGYQLSLLGKGYFNCASALKKQGEMEDAVEYYKKSLAAKLKFLAINPNVRTRQSVLSGYNALADALHEMGREEEAISYDMRAVEIEEFLYKEDPDLKGAEELSVSYNNVGNSLLQMGQTKEALDYFYKDLEIVKEIYAENQSQQSLRDLSISYNNVGHALLKLGDAENAAKYFMHGLNTTKELYKIEPTTKHLWELSINYENVESALANHGRTEESLEYLICAIVTRMQYHIAKEEYDECKKLVDDTTSFLNHNEDTASEVQKRKMCAMLQEVHGDYYAAIGQEEEAQRRYGKACELLRKICLESEDEENFELLASLVQKMA